jgi:hypothetical protein
MQRFSLHDANISAPQLFAVGRIFAEDRHKMDFNLFAYIEMVSPKKEKQKEGAKKK